MAHAVCDQCTTMYSPDAVKCPQCGATARHEQGTEPVPHRTSGQKARDAAAVEAAPKRRARKGEVTSDGEGE